MTGSRQQALVVARQLVRTFGSAPDPRRRAQAVMSELRRADDWSAAGLQGLEVADAWLRTLPPVTALQPRLRELLIHLTKA
jgi:broad specificity phosphatase PhoE